MSLLDSGRHVTGRWAKAAASLVLCVPCALTCAPPSPKFASWEPLGEQIPSISDPLQAKALLALSRRYWGLLLNDELKGWPDGARFGVKSSAPQYSYVRAYQLAADRVQFTILSVEGDRVVARGLSEINPRELKSPGGSIRNQVPTLPTAIYRELGPELGTHGEGFPLFTINDIYDQCEREIDRRDVGPVQLYFHPSGVLMQCGRALSRCSDCATLSIQTYSMTSLRPYAAEFDASHWACTDNAGLVLPGTVTWTHARQDFCYPPELAAARSRRLSQTDALFEDFLEMQCGKNCNWPWWTRSVFSLVCPISPAPLSFLEVGKPHPNAPFVVRGYNLDPIECLPRDLINSGVTRRQPVPTLKDLESGSSKKR